MKKQQGLTLIEVMISLVIGLFLLAGTLSIYINTTKSSADTIKAVRLNHDLEMAINLMANDIKRSGYWGNAKINQDSRTNLFTDDAMTTPSTTARTNILILNANTTTVASPGTCILYTYDADSDGVVDSNEYYGFRLNNNSLEMRLSGTTTADCSDGSWQEFIDGNTIAITGLQFSFTALGNLTGTTRCLNLKTGAVDTSMTCATTGASVSAPQNVSVRRLVNITLSGRLVNDSDVTKSVSSTVEIRNNRLYQRTS